MAVTNNVLNAINVFSSTSVFNSNKGSVGANDLNFIKQTTAELATEGGGIIAQSLGTNGYVKFANGLILQWGYHGSMNQETTALVNLPIAFTTEGYWCHMSTSSSNPSNRGIITAVPNGTSQIKLINGNAGIANCRWYIVGKQQWGYATGPGNPWAITFPITFSSAGSYVANSTPAYTESLDSQYCFKNASWTNTSITVYSSNKTTFRTYWFAIGK